MNWKRRRGAAELELRRFSFFCPVCHSYIGRRWTSWHLSIWWLACPFVRLCLFAALVWHARERGRAQPTCPQAQVCRARLGDGTEPFRFPQQVSPHPALSVLPVTLVTSPSQLWLPKNEGLSSEAGCYQLGHSWHTGLNKLSQGFPRCCEMLSPGLHLPEANMIISLQQPKVSLGVT